VKLTPFFSSAQRFTMEWKNGSSEDRISYRSFNYDLFNQYINTSPSSLLKIHWLRLVVDEGHSMGKNKTNAIDFASWITAERRWAMTGTPTPQTVQTSGLANLFGLFKFLKHDYFCTAHWGDEVCRRQKGDLACYMISAHNMPFSDSFAEV